jgi:hypothetical protein
LLRVGASKIHRRGRDRQVLELDVTGVLKTMDLVTRSDREFSGKSNWHDLTPEFENVVMSVARIISTELSP